MSGVQGIQINHDLQAEAAHTLEEPSRVSAGHQQAIGNTVATGNTASSQQAASSSPTGGAREATQLNHKEIEQLAEERAMENPDYAELKAKLEMCSGLEDMFQLIEKNVGWQNDDTITLSDILALVNDTNAPNKEARAAAKWLNDHRDILSSLKKGDDRIGLHDVKDFIAGMKAQLKEMKEAARAEIKAENPAASPSGGAAPGGSASNVTPSSTSTGPGVESLVPRPPPSSLPGMDGATENLANTADYLQAQMMALAEEAAKDPSKATLNGQKIAMLQNKFQAITNMMNQLTQMISNMSKMWSDVAMNSIRNLK